MRLYPKENSIGWPISSLTIKRNFSFVCLCFLILTACQSEDTSSEDTSETDSSSLDSGTTERADLGENQDQNNMADQIQADHEMRDQGVSDSDVVSDAMIDDTYSGPVVQARIGDELLRMSLRNCETDEDVDIVARAQEVGGIHLLLTTAWLPEGFINQFLPLLQEQDRALLDYMFVVFEDSTAGEITLESCRAYAAQFGFEDASDFYLPGEFFEALWIYPSESGNISLPWSGIIKGGEPPIYCHADGSGTDLNITRADILSGEEPTCAPPPPPPLFDQPCGTKLSCLVGCLGDLEMPLTAADTLSRAEEDNPELGGCMLQCFSEIDTERERYLDEEARDLFRDWQTCVDSATASGDQVCIMDRGNCPACETEVQACFDDIGPPPCTQHGECPDLKTYCSPNGICEPSPCILESEPICGRESSVGPVTYQNYCFLALREAEALSNGACVFCEGQPDCDTDAYCFPASLDEMGSICVSCASQGFADFQTLAIEDLVSCFENPVCGTDNQIYASNCQAACEGNVDVASEVMCE